MSTSTELTPYAASPIQDRLAYAQQLAAASDLIPTGLHDKIMVNRPEGSPNWVPSGQTEVNPGKVLLVMEYGAMLGLHPIAALSGIHVIEGKPAGSAALISAVVRKAGHTLRVTTEGVWPDTFKATATLTRSDDPEFTYSATWDRDRAATAKLLGKDNWVKYPQAMAKARAVTEVCREGAEDALLGVHYTPEELGANTDDLGEIVQEASEAEAPQAPAEPSALPKKRAAKGAQGTRKPAPAAELEPPAEEEDGPGEIIVEPEPDEPGPLTSPSADAEGIHDGNGNTKPWPEGSPLGDQGDGIDYANRVELADAARAALDLDDEAAVKKYNATHGKVTGRFATSHAEMARTDERMRADGAESAERIERARIAAEQERAVEAADARGPAEDAAAAVAATEGAKRPTSPTVEPEPPQEPAEPATEGPVDYQADLLAATTLDALRGVWDAATAADAMTSELRAAVTKRKAQMLKWLADGTSETLDAYVARVEQESRDAEAAGS